MNAAAPPLDAGDLIDRSAWSRYQQLVTGLSALAIVIDGFDIQILAFAIPSLIQEWHATRAQFAPVLALGLAGMAVGGPVFGYIGDRLGRRPALISAVLLFGLATIATAFIHSVAALSLLRFITGVGAGGAVPNAGTLAAEFAPLRRRAAAVKLTIVCVPLGGMLGGLIAARVLPAYGWRALYLCGGAVPIVFALVLWWLLPESPRFLARQAGGWPALAHFLNRIGQAVPLDSRFEDGAGRQATGRVPISALFGAEHLRQTAGLWLLFFCCMGAIYLVFGWLPTLLGTQGFSVAAASNSMALYNFGGVLGVLIWAVLTTRFGSRRPLLWCAVAAGFGSLAVWRMPPGWLLPALAVHGLLGNALATSAYALAAHVYPTAIRSSGIAWAASLGRVGGILGSLYGAALIGLGAGAYWGGFAVAMIGACTGLMLVSRHVPAGSGK